MDRGNIMRHLLNSQTDPFNRQPLTSDQLVDEVDLKQKIENWLKERRNKWSLSFFTTHNTCLPIYAMFSCKEGSGITILTFYSR